MEKISNIFWECILIHIDAIPVIDYISLDFFGSKNHIQNKMDLGLCEFFNWDSETQKCSRIKISFNRALQEMREDVVNNVICHEIAHAIAGVENEEHGLLWKEVVYALGGNLKFI